MLGLGTNIIKADLYSSVSLAANFDGTDDFITVPDDNALSFTSSTGFGISVWINLATMDDHGIINKDEEYNLIVRNIAHQFQFEFTVIDDSENEALTGISVHPVSSKPINEWIHIFAEYNTSKSSKVYINNTTPGQSSSNLDFVEIENTSGDLLIGKAHNSSGGDSVANKLITGAITNLCIYSGILTSTEKTDIYNAGISGNFTDHSNNTVIAYYPLTSDFNDTSGNNHHGSSASGQAPTFTTI
jgi:hypothetical protein